MTEPATDDASGAPGDAFRDQLDAPERGLVAEYLDFLRAEGKWWALPILIALLALGALMLVGSSAIGGLIYPFF